MAVGVCVRLVLRAAVLSAFLVAPQLSSAQSDASYVDTDASFYEPVQLQLRPEGLTQCAGGARL